MVEQQEGIELISGPVGGRCSTRPCLLRSGMSLGVVLGKLLRGRFR